MQILIRSDAQDYLGFAAKSFSWVQGVGCGVWGFTDFEVVSYLIFREKVPEFYPRSLQWSALFEVKKV
ncbi:hypothetical protein [Microcystis aeruginosa]|uniref:Type IV pilin PilA n=1 Tax=Microcystis aeruginosa (strain NIES-843 / IAM M-2473) TaxID=449447 RepID=B0JQ49_MICAN|nr:hypothetical protein [Microcystis aeruginosa]BAG00508.1 unknown protein [Microcystis aeruginosa NIES-843]